MKYVKVKGLTFEVQEYAFSQTPKGSTDRYRSKNELLDKYKEIKDITKNESLKLYEDVRKYCSKEVSMVSVRDHKKNTLNLAIASRNRVAEMRINLDDILVLDMIHLHKWKGDIIDTILLKSTLKTSKLQYGKSKVENQLVQEVGGKGKKKQVKVKGSTFEIQ